MNEQPVREIVKEELEKREATAVTIAPTINVSQNAPIEKIAEKVVQEIGKSISQTPRHA
ncbi:hypothetical protein ACPV3A_16625 [Paenibacillus sp. Dod16]|uniref:hypothetical protein n=1 Tax=Paenibacillus sp. Dod16 TaxID=3416392 RepID=UPI003CF03254